MALSLLDSTGANIKHENRMETAQEQFSQGVADIFQQNDADADVQAATISYSADTYDWTTRHIGLATIVLLLLFSVPLYLFFRRSPAYPNIRFSEFFVAVVYSMNMITIYSIVADFFCFNYAVDMCAYTLLLIPIKQLSGYSYWRTFLRIVLALLLFIVAVIVILMAVSIAIGIFSHLFLN